MKETITTKEQDMNISKPDKGWTVTSAFATTAQV